jgi:hypothetical protein
MDKEFLPKKTDVVPVIGFLALSIPQTKLKVKL